MGNNNTIKWNFDDGLEEGYPDSKTLQKFSKKIFAQLSGLIRRRWG